MRAVGAPLHLHLKPTGGLFDKYDVLPVPLHCLPQKGNGDVCLHVKPGSRSPWNSSWMLGCEKGTSCLAAALVRVHCSGA